MATCSVTRMVMAWSLAFGTLAVQAGELTKPGEVSTVAAAPESAAGIGRTNSAEALHLEFRNAPLNLVLEYLSDAAGFVINKEADVKGTVDVVSKDPVSKAEAVELLNAALKKNGYAVIRESAHGRVLTIVSLDTAKTSDLEISQGSDPNAVEKSSEVVTQVIPVRYANATQLMNNLQVLLPTSASLSVNESANTLILVAAKTDIRRMLRIVSALDSSIASVSSIKVFPLRYADAKQLATVVQQLFTQQATGQGAAGGNARAQLFNFPGGGPGGPFGAMPVGAAGAGDSGSAVNALKLSAAADEISNSLIVCASTGMLETIAGMVKQIDRPVADVTELRAFHLVNADPTELADQLAQLFPDSSQNKSDQTQASVRFGGGPPGAGGAGMGGPGGFGGGGPPGFFGGPGGVANNAQADGSDRAKKQSRVLAVADSRTSSLLVSAASTLMPEIARMIAQLDASPAKREVVKVFELQNANAHDVNQILQDLFNRNNTARTTGNNRNSLLGDNDPLATRETQQQQNSTASGTSRTGGVGGAGGAGATGTQGF